MTEGEVEEEWRDTWYSSRIYQVTSAQVLRNTTLTDQYLNYNSNHPLEHKQDVVRTLIYSAKSTISDLNVKEGAGAC